MSSLFQITLAGLESDSRLRLDGLILQLDAIKKVLNKLDALHSGKATPGLFYRINSIQTNSPMTTQIEAFPDQGVDNYGAEIFSRFMRDVGQITVGDRPQDASSDLLRAYKAMAKPLSKHIKELRIGFKGVYISIHESLQASIDTLLGNDEMAHGSIMGSLETADIHDGKNVFKIYPVIGPASVQCHFPPPLLPQALAAIGRFVRVHGAIFYKKTDPFPFFVEVKEIECLPEQSDVDSFIAMRGIAKDTFAGQTSEQIVEAQRNEW